MNPRYGTQNSPTSILKLLHVSTHIIGFHFWKHSAIRIMSVSDILFNPCGVFPSLRLGRYHCVHPEITARINSYHWLSFLEA